jgi:arylsulfatase A-like enzyme
VKRWDRTSYFIDHALDFLQRHQDKPCYVEIWPDDVHTPWVPNLERERAKPNSSEESDFCAVLTEYDRQVGRLLDTLHARGEDQNTLFIFTSDNGPLPSFHHARTGGLRGSKLSLYEGGIRVPFIARWPGHITPGKVDEQTVLESVDLFPTFCAVAHAPLPTGFNFDGQDMTEALTGTALVPSKTIFWEYGRNQKSFSYPAAPIDRSPHVAIREDKWKLLVNPDGTRTELYDMKADPNETTDLAQKEPEMAQKLKTEALAWRQSLPKLPDSPESR